MTTQELSPPVPFNLDALVNILSNEIAFFVAGVLVSAIIGLLTIHVLLDFVARFGFGAFTVYRALLAIAIVMRTEAKGARTENRGG